MKLAAIVAAILLALCLLAGGSPPGSMWLPRCPFYEGTGLLCYGCGSTRALQALAQGHLLHSLRCNALLLPALAWLVALCSLKGHAFALATYGGLGALGVFMALRNLPFAEFLRP